MISNANKTFLLDIFCGSSSTLFSAFVLSCAACYMYFFFLENTLYLYIEFDNTDYTRCSDCLQNSKVCFTGRYAQSGNRLISVYANEDRDRVNLIVCLGNIEVKQCICIAKRDLTPVLNRRDTAKLLINRCPTFTN